MAEPRRILGALPDEELAAALRELAPSIAYPSVVPTMARGADLADLAGLVRRRIELAPRRTWVWRRVARSRGLDRGSAGLAGRPLRRGLVIALVALLVLAAVAGAVGLGLPGLRIIFGDGPSQRPSAGAPSSTIPSASLSPLGASLALGTALPYQVVQGMVDFDLTLPTDPDLGPADASYIVDGRVALVWTSRAGLPETESPGVGLVLSELRGTIDEGFFQKILGPDTTLVTTTVGGSRAYWISGAPHFFLYIDAQGEARYDEHRVVGDVLLWTAGDVTYRLETSLGMAASIRIAESLR